MPERKRPNRRRKTSGPGVPALSLPTSFKPPNKTFFDGLPHPRDDAAFIAGARTSRSVFGLRPVLWRFSERRTNRNRSPPLTKRKRRRAARSPRRFAHAEPRSLRASVLDCVQPPGALEGSAASESTHDPSARRANRIGYIIRIVGNFSQKMWVMTSPSAADGIRPGHRL